MLPYPTILSMRDPEPTSSHQLASPLVELFSVRIHNDGVVPRKLCGQVQVIDGFGDTYRVYDKKHGDFETIGGPNGDGALSLCDPRCDVDDGGFVGMSPSSKVVVRVELEDISRGEIVQGELVIPYEVSDCYDKPWIERFGFATVNYATLRAAALATVSMSYMGGENDQQVSWKVYGSLFACYGREYGPFCRSDEQKYFQITLFDKARHEPAEMKSGGFLSLTRSVLAVPAHSSIIIRGCLWDADNGSELVVGDILAKFGVRASGENSLVLQNRIKVGVKFGLGETLLF